MFNLWKKKSQDDTEPQIKVDVKEGGTTGIRVVINGQDIAENMDSGELTSSEAGRPRTSELLIETVKSGDSDIINVNDPHKAKLIRNQVAESLSNNEDTMRMAARIAPLVDGDSDRAESIARTASVYAFSASTVNFGKESGAKKKEWQAIILPLKKSGQKRKGSACDDCAALDSKLVRIDQQFTSGDKKVHHPPLHEGCRCTIKVDYPYEP